MNGLDPPTKAVARPDPALLGPRLAHALKDARLGLWEWNLRTQEIAYSDEALDILGLARDELSPQAQACRGLVHPEDADLLWEAEAAARQGLPFEAEYRICRPDGSQRWVLNQARPACDAQGNPVSMLGTLQDITGRKETEHGLRGVQDALELRVRERTEALECTNARIAAEVEERRAAESQVRELLAQLVSVEEAERKRVARELHDTVGQHLTAISLTLKSIQDDPQLPDAPRERLLQLQRHIHELDIDIDRLAHQLRPAALDDLGLDDALRQQLRRWSDKAGIPVDIHTAGLQARRFAPALETTVYRVVQEALTNVLRHASATRVSVVVECRHGELRTIIEDDGCGFAAGTASAEGSDHRGLGLRGMRERALAAGGRFEVESEPSRGSALYLVLPVRTRATP